MRIAHISDCFYPRLGGIEVQVGELARLQAAAGHEVAVVTATPGEPGGPDPEVRDGVRVFRTVAPMPFQLPVHPRTAHVVRPVLGAWRPSVVHVHVGVVSPYAWGGLRAALRLGRPTVITVHSVWDRPARAGYRRLAAGLRLAQRRAVWGAVSSVAGDRIRAATGDDVPILATPNGVDLDQWNPIGRIWHEHPVRLVTGMRLAPRKRSIPLIDMFAEALATGGDPAAAVLTIAGDGPHRSRVEAHIRRRGVAASVHLAGRLNRPALRRLYLDSDVYVQPSVMESFGLAALEARATGLPVVARSQTGLVDFVAHEVDGLLADDDAAMSAAILRLIRDRDLRRRITEHNVAVPPEQSWRNVLAAVDAAYEAAVHR